MKPIKSALISVFHKDGLEDIVRLLHAAQVKIFSTGGTLDFIESLSIPAVAVESLTSYPAILGGRVKTLHPSIFGGILARRDHAGDAEQMKQYDILEIDLVIVDLYPFEKTVQQDASEQEVIEKIDIGGISLIRAAAKNHKDVLIVPAREHYAELLELLQTQACKTDLAQRKRFAAYAFQTSSHYDTAIFQYFNQEQALPSCSLSLTQTQTLRYGENPHQKGRFYGDLSACFDQLQGKEISYNNLLDIDAAVHLMADFDETTFAIIKHNNACGLASRPSLLDAWNAALAGDPISAFGGVLIANRAIDRATAEEVHKLFFEVLIAPDFAPEALEILGAKKNRILLRLKNPVVPQEVLRTALNGILSQDRDSFVESAADLKVTTEKAPREDQIADLLFANKIVKHTKSNAIVFAKNRQLLASGVGQTSRVDALRQAIEKAHAFHFDLHDAVMASDAFFPFPDCVELAAQAGVSAIVQPGGSIQDQNSVDACNARGVAMVTTGHRHFKH